MRDKIRPLVQLVRRYSVFWSSFAVGLIVFLLFFSFVYQRRVAFSYTSPYCSKDVTLFPKLLTLPKHQAYKVTYGGMKTIGGYPIVARQTCFEALQPPKAGQKISVTARLFGIPGFGKRYGILPKELPVLTAQPLGEKISIRDPLIFPLSANDEVFDYVLTADEQTNGCEVKQKEVICDVVAMKLLQNKQYKIKLAREFSGKKQDTITDKNVTTVDPVVVSASSIPEKSVIYDKRTDVRLTTNKKLTQAKAVLYRVEATGKKEVATKLTIEGQDVVIRATDQLARNSNFELVLGDAVAEDRGVLMAPQTLRFSVSGGPKMKGVSVSKTGAATNKPFIISFDQPLAANQDISKQVSLTKGSQLVPATISVSNSSLIITSKAAVPLCTTFTIKLGNDIQSNYGISGNSAWTYTFRTICYSVSAIGYSVKGRPIHMYQFGSGARKILYVGTTHGDEGNTKTLLDLWIRELDANAQKIPAGVTILIIPNLNPDGQAAKTRKNAHGVDLNRNFPANDWKADVTMPGGAFTPGGGGVSALSEPESKALSDLIVTQRPSLVLTYHSAAAVVTANGSGNSATVAATYARLSGYRNLPHSQNNQVFQYDTTGAFEDWLHDKVGISALLIELATTTKDEFSRNKEAMWAVL